MRKSALIILLLPLVNVMWCKAQGTADAAVSNEIQAQLAKAVGLPLNFPGSVDRFYRGGGFRPSWIGRQINSDAKWQAMSLIDCVQQYGLYAADYHPKDLMYDKLHDITETPDKVSAAQKARFDIMLTDAMLTMANYLHYGKLNPNYGQSALDNGLGLPFNAERALRDMMSQRDFTAAMMAIQPKSKIYSDLQYKLRQLKGLYDGDCYDVPEATMRKIAINMERLRWARLDDNVAYVHVNIPSFNLTYHSSGSDKNFRIVVGAATTPTPVLQSKIEYFTTAPEWNVPQSIFIKELLPKAIKDPVYLVHNDLTIYNNLGPINNPDRQALKAILKSPKGYYVKQASGCDNALGLLVFRFQNIFSVYLHDTPDKAAFSKDRRDLSHGCIRVENAGQLAALLLKNDKQESQVARMGKNITNEKRENFVLRKPVPIAITYLTCVMSNGELTTYNDIYKLDKSLEMALYNVSDSLTLQ